MRPSVARLAISTLLLGGCGGGAPLMHTAHPLPEDHVTMGAGFSGSVNVDPPETGEVPDRVVEEGATAPGFAPWVAGRLGLGSDWDAGLAYTARTVRADIRHGFVFAMDPESSFETAAISLSLGASGILPKRDDDLGMRVGGFGADLPLLFGLSSDSDVYNAYIGPRLGFEHLNGQRELAADPNDPTAPLVESISGWHLQAGGIFGFRVGFRYLYAAIELGGAYHWAQADVGAAGGSFGVFALRPAGALIGRF